MEMNQTRIPKIVHYCWFGGKPLPASLQECVDSWKLLEGYQVKRWDETNCSFDENEFVRRTYREKQLGYIGDFYRLKALYDYGGIYLDTDVKVYKSFDPLLEYPVFLNFIFDSAVGSAIIGARPQSPFIKRLLDMYDATVFGRNADGRVFNWRDGALVVNGYATSNYYYTYHILKNYPGFLLNNKFQNHGDFVIFPKEQFEIGTLGRKPYAVHLCAGEWRINENTGSPLKIAIKRTLKKVPFVYDKVQIVVRRRRYRKLNRDIPFYPYQQAQKHNTARPEL